MPIYENAESQSPLERSKWEYECIYNSLKDANCDDVIRFLLSDMKAPRKLPNRSQGAGECTPDSECSVPSVLHGGECALAARPGEYKKQTPPLSPDRCSSSLCSANDKVTAPNSLSSANMEDGASDSASMAQQKPPVCPVRSSTIINLDKNRIKVKRQRSKLVPRPISLPSSFNLLRNLRISSEECASRADEEKIDIELIRQLEDEIYRSRNEVTESGEHHHGRKETCAHCQTPVGSTQFQPNQVSETKMFEEEMSRFGADQHALLLLDAWQLQPMLMKRDKMDFCDFYNEEIIRLKSGEAMDDALLRSVLIVDNSSFYPILMKYEIGKKGSVKHEEQPFAGCECIENSDQTKQFTQLFQQQMTNLMQQNKAEKCSTPPSIPAKAPNAPNGFSGELSAMNASTDKVADKTRRSASIFKRFLQQSRKLNLGLREKRSHLRASKSQERARMLDDQHGSESAQTANIQYKNNNNDSDMPCANNFSDAAWMRGDKANGKGANHKLSSRKPTASERHGKIVIKNTKMNWLLHTKPKINSFKQRLMLRRHTYHAASDKLSVTGPDAIIAPNAHLKLFSTCSWSSSDLSDINNANTLHSIYLQYKKLYRDRRKNRAIENRMKKFQCDWSNKKFVKNSPAEKSANISSSIASERIKQCRQTSQSEKSPKRTSSHRLKRHSVGSETAMTDVVKTWVYRRRCLYIS